MEYTFKGTPGPWKVINNNGLLFVAASPYKGHPYNGRTTTIEVMSDEEYPTKLEDAHLIAAAPDLLEACILTLQSLEMHNLAPQSQHTLMQAIKKALNL